MYADLDQLTRLSGESILKKVARQWKWGSLRDKIVCWRRKVVRYIYVNNMSEAQKVEEAALGKAVAAHRSLLELQDQLAAQEREIRQALRGGGEGGEGGGGRPGP